MSASSSVAPAIRLEDVRFAYGREGDSSGGFVLEVDRLVIDSGTRWALFGPSGSGKTTLLNLVAGELVASQGEVEVAGARFDRASDDQRRAHRIRNLGFVFQDAPLLQSLDVVENVLLPYRINPALELTAEVVGRARSLADELGLGARLSHAPSQLSTGERQRACLARALVTQPRILLADEPTAGLDPAMTANVLDLLDDRVAQAQLTLLLVTHDPAVLERFDQRIEVVGAGASRSTVQTAFNAGEAQP